jgi:hypothetical protein
MISIMSQDRAWISHNPCSLRLAKCETLIWRLRWWANGGFRLGAWVATRQKSVWCIKFRHTLFLERELHRSMYFILHVLMRPMVEVSKSILVSSLFESHRSLLITLFMPYETFWQCQNVEVLVFNTLVCCLWPWMMRSKGVLLKKRLDWNCLT